jgi:hypothetical protein
MARPPATLQNWLLGGAEKKFQLLRKLLENPGREWGEEELATEIDAGRIGSIDEHLEILVQMELAQKPAPRRYRLVPYHALPDHLQDVRDSLEELLNALHYVAADEVVRPNKR